MKWVRLFGCLVVSLTALYIPVMSVWAAGYTPPPRCADVQFPPDRVSVASFVDSPNHRYFPETKHSLNDGFKAFWETNGGLAIFGFPIEEEHGESLPNGTMSRTVQRFERARFEYHPENKGTPYEVELGQLGRERVLVAAPFPPPPPGSDARYYPETGHTLSEAFAAFWDANGALPIFGYPIAQPFTDATVQPPATVQWFERARMEVHAERGGAVLLTRLGAPPGTLCIDDTGTARSLQSWDV